MGDCPPPNELGFMAALQRSRAERRRERWRRAAVALIMVVLGGVGVSSALLGGARESPQRLSGDMVVGGTADSLDGTKPHGVSVPMPTTPLPHWKNPPCKGRKERAINGACWKELRDPPGEDRCGEDYEHAGSCWAPVGKPRRPPLTIQE